MALLALVGGSMSACADETSWKEEVLLHDGSKIVVERSQTYGGRHEIGQKPPIKEQEITFTLPGSSRSITWKSEYSEDIGRANFNLLALHVLNGTPYIVAGPNLCLAYNKWGRPNPPYVFLKYDGKAWQRIPLSTFPAQFKDINVVVNSLGAAEDGTIVEAKLIAAEKIREINSRLWRYPNEQLQYKTILREPFPTAAGGCPVMVRITEGWGKGGWRSPDGPKAPIPTKPAIQNETTK
ncbi:hypothetical protein [Thiobacillus sp. 63-78]|uniref:hypothetical protein n=1 Tax=Thiobacillus sp. 63-78 TaxID=1895859 RepID=UPI001ACA617E|nr:hypothetical protein [Thiobacillus sp. 63-78]MBN8764556.1 hypothetical protein [Thiobacillus sp.]